LSALLTWMRGIIVVGISGINVTPAVGAYFISINYSIPGVATPLNVSLRYAQ
jgi:hypothetical protein